MIDDASTAYKEMFNLFIFYGYFENNCYIYMPLV